MNEFVTFIRDCYGPAAAMFAFVQETASKFRRELVRRALGGCRIRQINPLLTPDKLILGTEMKVIARHRGPQRSSMWTEVVDAYNSKLSQLVRQEGQYFVDPGDRAAGRA